MAGEESYTIYEDRKGRQEKEPFPGWVYYTEYTWTPEGFSMATGINQNMRLTPAQRAGLAQSEGGRASATP